MTLSEQIEGEIKTALKARETEKLSILRMAKSAIGAAAIKKGKDVLDDAEVIEVLGRMVKQHEESVAAFEKGGRKDLAEKETREAAFLKVYLPEQISDEELKKIIQAAIDETKASGPKGMGQVMKVVVPKVKGRADGKKVNELVRQLLG